MRARVGFGVDVLDSALIQVVRESDASVGMVYVLPPGEGVLRMAVVTGGLQNLVADWTRVALDAPIPVADAVRERRLVWLDSREELANRYPRPALVLPYKFAVAALPITDGAGPSGALVLAWPGAYPGQPAPPHEAVLRAWCERMNEILRQAADRGHPLRPGPSPRILATPRAQVPGPLKGTEALAFVDRLPGGCCGLDLNGEITFVDATAAELLGTRESELLGSLPWEVLPWLDGPAFEDRSRAGAVSREPQSLTVQHPSGRWLELQCHGDESGTSVYITPTDVDHAPEPGESTPPAPTGATRAHELYHLMHLAASLTEAVGVREVVDRAAEQLMAAFGVQALALLKAHAGRLSIIGHRGYSTELMRRFDDAPLTGDAPAERVLATGTPSFFTTFADLKRAHPPAVHQDGMASWAFLPLIASGTAVGSLVLAYERPHPFPTEERAVLTSVAGLIAQALDRARLHDVEHHLTRSLQEYLLPRALPRVEGLDVAARYLPATRAMDIGGDFYDLIRVDDTTVVAAIGDVQGHNVNAAALMGQVRTAVHASAGAPPGEVLTRTNHLLTDLAPDLFTTCLYAHLDLRRETAHLANAGHPPPILRYPDGHTDILRLRPGLPLGIDSRAEYHADQIPLPTGAVLALYTDGLIETPGADIDDAIADLAGQLTDADLPGVDALADALIDRSERAATRADDIALLLIHPRSL
ncbi:SpoIIE family protein phosphatase [Streptomyces sp. SBT349]|uniref:SpoIIE family protein phosphatase n=1 Tax=Streptomyces sp. SBT349 TaxID=1580539 RepID=UPI00066C2A4C|nr:SpoIIE family protein phosphatase [Streptomyces sp. SBT349]